MTGLTAHELEQLRISDTLLDVTLELAELAWKKGGSFISIENLVHRGGDPNFNKLFQLKFADHFSLWNHECVEHFR